MSSIPSREPEVARADAQVRPQDREQLGRLEHRDLGRRQHLPQGCLLASVDHARRSRVASDLVEQPGEHLACRAADLREELVLGRDRRRSTRRRRGGRPRSAAASCRRAFRRSRTPPRGPAPRDAPPRHVPTTGSAPWASTSGLGVTTVTPPCATGGRARRTASLSRRSVSKSPTATTAPVEQHERVAVADGAQRWAMITIVSVPRSDAMVSATAASVAVSSAEVASSRTSTSGWRIERSGDAEPLALAARQPHAPLADDGVDALGEAERTKSAIWARSSADQRSSRSAGLPSSG